jgi:hypothetical protein
MEIFGKGLIWVTIIFLSLWAIDKLLLWMDTGRSG